MMLQRTRADQVKGVYGNFFNEYSSPEEVASTPQEELNTILAPLGLNWRFSKFKEVAVAISEQCNGEVPAEREELKKLPGVGQYISGIVTSTAFDQPQWIIDSNVVRVFKRFFGLDPDKGEARRHKDFKEHAAEYSKRPNSREANFGLIDFGAIVCKPSSPDCSDCPVSGKCCYIQENP